MLKQWLRTFYSDNGELTDKSLDVQGPTGMDVALTKDEDFIYLGQYFPFNNLNFEVEAPTGMDNDVKLVPQYWGGKGVGWKDCLDVLDSTLAFKQSGVLQYTPDKLHAWNGVSNTGDNSGGPDELEDIAVYDLYWLRIKASDTPTLAKKIKKIGYAFCRHADLSEYQPDINEYLDAWGLTNWNSQIVLASEKIIADLKASGLIVHPGQILRFEDVHMATVYQTLLFITAPLGTSWDEKRKEWKSERNQLMNIKRFTIDKNKSATVEPSELVGTVSEGVR